MSIVPRPHTYTPNTTISSSQANANEDTLYNDYNGNISAANLATDAVTTAKIADSNVTTAKINDSAVTTAKINDEAVSNAKLKTGAGEPGGAWNSWTPTWTNLTISSSTVSAAYKVVGKTCHFRLKMVAAGSFAVTGTPVYFSLPVTASSSYTTNHVIGNGHANDTATGKFNLLQVWMDTNPTLGRLIYYLANTTYTEAIDMTSGIPFTWSNGDAMWISGSYEAA